MVERIDLRSDTVTMPTPAMREAMFGAEVGDDILGEDPTMQRLEAAAAERIGKEAAIFVASGTMGNLVAQLTHCGRGDEVILGDINHILNSEFGGGAALGSLSFRAIPTDKFGMVAPNEVRSTIRPKLPGVPRTGLMCMENTVVRRGGTVITLEQMSEIKRIAGEHGIPVHLDGARVFNAAAYLGVDVREVTSRVDSVMFCLSKGLSAPVGSMLAGSKEFIERARIIRRMVGGGMRQSGVLAAAGLVAIEQMTGRLVDDHRNARRLAEALARLPGVSVDLETAQTNIVLFQPTRPGVTAGDLQASLARHGLLVSNLGRPGLRLVTHAGIGEREIDRAIEILERVLSD